MWRVFLENIYKNESLYYIRIFKITREDLAATRSPLPRKLHMVGAKDRGARWRDDSDLYGEVLSAGLEAKPLVMQWRWVHLDCFCYIFFLRVFEPSLIAWVD